MKRFYQAAAAVPLGGGRHGITLDGRAVRTPARAELWVPSRSLAAAMAAEWAAQGDQIDVATMPMNGLANAAIDRVTPDQERFAAALAAYADSDLTAYRAEGPAPLVERQQAVWTPIISWAKARYGVDVQVIAGIVHQPQPSTTLARLARVVGSMSAFHLAGLNPLVTVSGSLLIALAVTDGALSVEAAFKAAELDEDWQAEQWGSDSLALNARAAREKDFRAGARFFSLL